MEIRLLTPALSSTEEERERIFGVDSPRAALSVFACPGLFSLGLSALSV
jgi:hypothetical protein